MMQNSNMIMSIFMFYYQKKGIPSENPFLFRKELHLTILLYRKRITKAQIHSLISTFVVRMHRCQVFSRG